MRIVVAPQHVGTGMLTAFRSIKRLRPQVAVFTELDLGRRSYVDQLQHVLGKAYRVLSKDRGRHSQEIPVAVRGHVVDFKLLALSPNVGTRGVGNDRWVAIVTYRPFVRRHVVVHTHLDAVIQSHHTGQMLHNERTSVTAAALRKLEDILTEALNDPKVGGRVSFTGDTNLLPVGPGTGYPHAEPWVYAPQVMLKRLGMVWRNSRVIYYAAGHGYRLARSREIPAHSRTNPADHGWLDVTVRTRLRSMHRRVARAA